ncbi:MAG: hypothetical protein HYZ28_18885 [Myxococcales bacterium]|nr:hypothetical protein [Myxococcales bacterium]
MSLGRALALLVLLADPSNKGWEQAAREDGITIYSRRREGSPIAEMKAIGIIDAPPHAVWRAIRDYDRYPATMPYTEEAKVLSSEDGGKVIYFYSVIDAPLVDKRDYVIRILDESDWQDGKGYLKVSWTSTDKGPAEREGLIRVKVNDGFWKLEPRDGGKRTFATYYVHTDPGGEIPKWIANKANSTAVPNVFAAIRKVVAEEKP